LVLIVIGPSNQQESWVDPNAVPHGEALKKYARDLTALASAGKLDPVIGREGNQNISIHNVNILQRKFVVPFKC
jgi:ATP-dependent Clp protease ATP-binding subunit ClpA